MTEPVLVGDEFLIIRHVQVTVWAPPEVTVVRKHAADSRVSQCSPMRGACRRW